MIASKTKRIVVQLGKYYPPRMGGIEYVTELSAQALGERYEVIVVCHNDKNADERQIVDGVTVLRCATQLVLFRQPMSLAMGWRLRKIKPDIVHFHAPNFWAALMVQIFLPGTPVVVSHHCDVEGRWLLKRVLMPIYRRLAEKAECVFVSSEKNAARFSDLPSRLKRLSVIPYSVDDRKYDMSLAADESREACDQDSGHGFLLGFLGRLVWYKGVFVLLQALAAESRARLVIVGDGPLRHEIEAQITQLGLGGRVTLLGHVSEQRKIAVLRQIDALVFPSTHETEAFGLAQVEAQLSGKPVIATKLPTAASEVTLDEETGLLVAPGDAAALQAAITRLLENPAECERFGENGRRRALANYTQSKYKERLLIEFGRVESYIESESQFPNEEPLRAR